MADAEQLPPSEKQPSPKPEQGGGDSSDEPDETLKERLWGLTEMFPEESVDSAVATTENATKLIARIYKFFRTTVWIISTSALILLAPIYFEVVRLEYDRLRSGFGPCAGRSTKFMKRQGGGHPCQPFRPQPQDKPQEKPPQ